MTVKQLLARAAQCQDCGREHKPWRSRTNPGLAPQWSDRKDGHPYRPRLSPAVIAKVQSIAEEITA
jgi:hypothetical protein